MEVWDYYKKYFHPEKNDSYWDNLVADGRVIYEKYNDPIITDYVFAIQEELNRKAVA